MPALSGVPGEKLTESEREAIRASVRAVAPCLGRWKDMHEPLCPVALEVRTGRSSPGQKPLFPEDGDD